MNAHEVRRDGGGVRRLPAGPVLDVLFVILATPALVVVGLLAEAGRLPGPGRGGTPVAETLPAWGGVVLGAWMALVAVVALVLPLMALAIWGGNVGPRLLPEHRRHRRAVVHNLPDLEAPACPPGLRRGEGPWPLRTDGGGHHLDAGPHFVVRQRGVLALRSTPARPVVLATGR